MTLALPSAQAPAPRRQLMVAVGLVSAAVATLVGGMLAGSATVEELLERLGPRSSEPVEVDPGW